MPQLHMTLQDLDGVAEPLRAYYKQHEDGDWRLDVDGVEDVGGLKRSLEHAKREREEARRAARAAKQQAERFGDIDPEEHKRLRQESTERAERRARERGEFDKILERQKAEHAKALATKDGLLAAKDAMIAKQLVASEATAAIAGQGGLPTLLMPHVEVQSKAVEEDGAFVVRVIDQDGNARSTDDGAFMTVAELVAEMRASEDFGRAFDGSGQQGSGSGVGPAGQAAAGATRRSRMSVEEKTHFIAEHGDVAYLRLPY